MAQQQSSRLHRLLTLLDTGSTQATRFTAAKQIGEIAKSHPLELHSLLSKVSPYLRSKRWDTRVAAAHAIGSIAENVKHISLSGLNSCLEMKLSKSGLSLTVDDVMEWSYWYSKFLDSTSFRSFDLNKVLEFGPLLASWGQEYDVTSDSSKNPRERLARQKQNLRRRLGLDVCEQFMDVNDMIRDEDLMAQKFHSAGNGVAPQYFSSKPTRNIQQFVSKMAPGVKPRRPSAREMNLLKRKAKISSKDQSKVWPKDANVDASQSQELDMTSPRGIYPDILSLNKQFADTVSDDDTFDNDSEGVWPFQSFVEQLLLDVFDPVWEVRHGSIMALRDILSFQGASAGIIMPDLKSGSAPGSALEHKDEETKFKRPIDLNMQNISDDYQSPLKRTKIEGTSYQLSEEVITVNKDDDLGTHTCVDPGLNLPIGHTNGELPVSIKEEEGLLQSDVDSILEQSNNVEDTRVYYDDKQSPGKTSILNNLPENSELLNLVKLARHSSLRNCEFLQDCAIRFLCILSLDRFGDYVSDQVVAPVRETCAQALGAVLKFMQPTLVHETLKILLQMQRSPEWEIRHGSLLGIKYLVAVRQEMLGELLVDVIPACKAGLEDPDDDVRAVAADALIPTAAAIVSLKGGISHSIVMLLWDILLDLDDLSPSTSSVMNLLAELYSQEQMFPKSNDCIISSEEQKIDLNEISPAGATGEEIKSIENLDMLSTLAPRLWPFMRHSITSVRYSAIRTLERLLEAGHKRSISESSSLFWPSLILGDTLRIVFQNLLLESNEEIMLCSERVWRLLLQCPVKDLVGVAELYFMSWIELAATPYGSPLDAAKLFWPIALPRKSHFKAAAKMRAVKPENESSKSTLVDFSEGTISHDRIGDHSVTAKIVVGADEDVSVTSTRVVTATALGVLVSRLHNLSLGFVIDPMWTMLTSLSGVQRQVAALILISWFKEFKAGELSMSGEVITSVNSFRNWLLDLLTCTNPAFPTKNSLLPYAELSRTYSKMQNEAFQLHSTAEASGITDSDLMSANFDVANFTVDDAINLASKLPSVVGETSDEMSSERSMSDELESSKQRLLSTAGYLKCVQGNLHITVSSLLASAVVWMSELPSKLNPIILPLMASVRREQEEILQSKAAESLAELISGCIERKPSPNEKLLRNLCSLMCLDPCETPQASVLSSVDIIEEQELLSSGSAFSKQKSKVHMLSPGEDRSRVEGFISRRGSELALKYLCLKLGGLLFDKLPKLWDCLVETLRPHNFEGLTPEDEKNIDSIIDSVKDPQILINNIQVVRSIAPLLNEALRLKLFTLLPCIFRCVRHSHVAIRLTASRCIMTMAKSMTENVMGAVIESVIPMLSDASSVHARQGAGMLVSLLVRGLGMELVPYAPLLVVPLLGCMSDCDNSVRQSVTHSFAALVPLLPLARGVPAPAGLSARLTRSKEDAKFLEQLVDNSQIDDFKLSTELKVTLRRYQQEGINWLAFLRRFNLHGVLCDDMGLGKTLQASAIVASDVAEHAFTSNNDHIPPSIIICPSTLVAHWVYEIEKFIDTSLLTTLQYVGSAQDRISLQSQFDKHNVIVTSYDVVRKDIDYLRLLFWNYCILDEGHIIKNSKSKVTVAVKQLKAHHRLILSGTPIQNNVLDLWSLFDFLMPGFLGTERQFQATYGKPLLAARDPKCSAKDAEAGALAMEALHKQVMPFLLRRTKDEVLSDLPEKIIQDRFCDLSPLQLKLYERFPGSDVKQEISSIIKVNDVDAGEGKPSTRGSTHVFQALQYLLKLCSHPLLLVGEKFQETLSPLLSELFPGGSDYTSELHNIRHSPKLVALQEILEECGIGIEGSGSEASIGVGEHRVLIFAQHKSLLDIIERDLFRVHMKNVTYLRLDGSVEPEKRFDIVKAFNSDPTIDVLLLTTHVGGLGLNLTSADTLVFMEHDWNPMRDHQAMDRAHRLGQKKVVNVHRLIMRGTLEEKVMSLQRFKVSVANAVINADNASLKTMNTDQLLDLFTKADTAKGAAVSQQSTEPSDAEAKLPGAGKGLKKILGGLEDLWDQSQYTEEYDLSQFLAKLNG